MKRKIEFILFIILICILIFVVYLKFVVQVKNIKIFGYSFFIVKTGSMEPFIKPGELIIVKEKNDYKVEDVITYKENDIYITHRIIEKNGNKYTTKGDANNEKDLEILKKDIIGEIVFHSKILGVIIADYLKHIIIFYIVINLIIKVLDLKKRGDGLEV